MKNPTAGIVALLPVHFCLTWPLGHSNFNQESLLVHLANYFPNAVMGFQSNQLPLPIKQLEVRRSWERIKPQKARVLFDSRCPFLRKNLELNQLAAKHLVCMLDRYRAHPASVVALNTRLKTLWHGLFLLFSISKTTWAAPLAASLLLHNLRQMQPMTHFSFINMLLTSMYFFFFYLEWLFK